MQPTPVVIKHNNPCGAACDEVLARAFLRAYEGDPVSAFGSVIGLNRPVDAETANALCEPGRYIEAIVAPDFAPEAFTTLTTRPTWKRNVRLLKVGTLETTTEAPEAPAPLDYRRISGGLLVQTRDCAPDAPDEWQVVSRREPTDVERADLAFAWKVARHVKSNAIVFARDGQIVGVGAGHDHRGAAAGLE